MQTYPIRLFVALFVDGRAARDHSPLREGKLSTDLGNGWNGCKQAGGHPCHPLLKSVGSGLALPGIDDTGKVCYSIFAVRLAPVPCSKGVAGRGAA